MSKTYTAEELAEIVDKHGKWLRGGEGGERAYLERAYLRGAYLEGAYLERAYLEGAYLRGAYLRGAYLEGANLRGAYLEGAYLERAYLGDAYLEGAYLRGAYLEGANLRGAYLGDAYLGGANLRDAYLEGANLRGAYLRGAYLEGAKLHYWIIPEEGEFIAWKAAQTSLGVPVVLKLRIPAEAQRACCYTSRKCRVDRAISVAAYYKDGSGCESTEFFSKHDGKFKYELNVDARSDSFDADPREECTNGIHIFVTRKEAEDWA